MGSGNAIYAYRDGNTGRSLAHDSTSAGAPPGALGKLIDKLKRLELRISSEHGPFRLFGVFLRGNSPGVWDVVVAADWFSKLSVDPIEFIAKLVTASIGSRELMLISRVVPVSKTAPFLVAVNEFILIEHGLWEIGEADLGGVEISRGYVITSQRQPETKRKS